MWIFLNNSFLSVVHKSGDRDFLTVRARLPGDIEAVFPDAHVDVDAGTDYRFRARIPREAVAQVLHAQVMGLNYKNFKASIADSERHDLYMRVWSVMYSAQEKERASR